MRNIDRRPWFDAAVVLEYSSFAQITLCLGESFFVFYREKILQFGRILTRGDFSIRKIQFQWPGGIVRIWSLDHPGNGTFTLGSTKLSVLIKAEGVRWQLGLYRRGNFIDRLKHAECIVKLRAAKFECG